VKVDVVEGPLETVKADAVVVGVYAEEGRLRESPARIDKALGGQLAEVLASPRTSRTCTPAAAFPRAGWWSSVSASASS